MFVLHMKRYLRRHVAMFFECLISKVPGRKQQDYLQPIKPGRWPFSLIYMDHLGPSVKNSRWNQDLIIHNFTRFTGFFTVKDTSVPHVIKAVKEFVNEYGFPDRITTDIGLCFTSRPFKRW